MAAFATSAALFIGTCAEAVRKYAATIAHQEKICSSQRNGPSSRPGSATRQHTRSSLSAKRQHDVLLLHCEAPTALVDCMAIHQRSPDVQHAGVKALHELCLMENDNDKPAATASRTSSSWCSEMVTLSSFSSSVSSGPSHADPHRACIVGCGSAVNGVSAMGKAHACAHAMLLQPKSETSFATTMRALPFATHSARAVLAVMHGGKACAAAAAESCALHDVALLLSRYTQALYSHVQAAADDDASDSTSA